MGTIVYVIGLLFLLVVIAKSLININAIDKRIDEILAEETRQNKRIDVLEKREQIRQLDDRHDKACVETKDIFKKW